MPSHGLSIKQISSSPQRNVKELAAGNATLHLAANKTDSATKMNVKLTESYLPAVMQALAYYIELIQYEPLFSTTVEPPFIASTTPMVIPSIPSSSTQKPPVERPVTWWSPPSTTTQKPVTWWSPPSTTTTTNKPWCVSICVGVSISSSMIDDFRTNLPEIVVH